MAGTVLEVKVRAPGLETGVEGVAAVVVTGANTGDASGVIVAGRCVGGSPEEIHGDVANRINRRGQRVHLCAGDPSCCT